MARQVIGPVEAGTKPGSTRLSAVRRTSCWRSRGSHRSPEIQPGPMLEALAAQLDAEHRLFDDLKQTLADAKRPEAVFSDEQVDAIGRRLLSSCQTWSRSLVRAALWRSWAALSAIVLGALIVGGLESWLAFGRPSNEQCHDEHGGRWCGYWVPPTDRGGAMTGGKPPCDILHNCSAGWDHIAALPAMFLAGGLAGVLIFWWHTTEGSLNWPQRAIVFGPVAIGLFCGWHWVATFDRWL